MAKDKTFWTYWSTHPYRNPFYAGQPGVSRWYPHNGAKEQDKNLRRPRPMTGFLAILTPSQRTAVLAYRGDDILGDPRMAMQGE